MIPAPVPQRVTPLIWMSPARFEQLYPQHGPDHDYGMAWGRRFDQRISLRIEPEAAQGVLYVFDPTWNEHAVLTTAADRETVASSVQHVSATYSPRS